MTIRILNLAILLVAIALSALLVKKFFFQPTQNSEYRIAPEARLEINGINWADSERTVLVALAKECNFCTESAPFYRRLSAGLTNQTNTRLIALFSEKETGGEEYLKQLEVPIRDLRYVSLPSLGITNVPAVVILDRTGVVTDMWVGKLSPLKESALMTRLRLENTRPVDEWSINEAAFASKVAANEPLVLLDIRDRSVYALSPRDGARNIPLDELPVRAQNELPLDHAIVIHGDDPAKVDLAYSIINTQGFAKVFVLVHNVTKSSP